MLTDLYRRRALVQAFAQRDFATRYRSSALGWAWSLLQPLATLAIFAAVFSTIFKIPPPPLGADPSRANFAAFLFTGLVTWNLFTSIVQLSMSQLKSNGELLKKVDFPAWAPILGGSIVQLIQVLLELAVLVLMFVLLGNVGWTWLLAIPVLIGVLLFAQGIGLMLSVLNAHFGDVQHIVGVVLGAVYFITPILYPMSFLDGQPEWMVAIVKSHPMSWYVDAMHQAMYDLVAPSALSILAMLVGGFVVFWIGLAVFDRTSEDIGELL